MEDDWDLQAVVRGCCTSTTSNTPPPSPFLNAITTTSSATASIDTLSFLSPFLLHDEDDNQHLLSFPDLFATQTAIQELEQLCNPFFPQTQGEPQQQQQQQQQPRPPSISSTTAQIPRSKRRKNQQKRVVCQVPAEGLSSDMWAWRKYGQKPIKGSPYPRGYYRCSSSKGCLARKQVERSRSDPSMFVITYTSEHNHPLPTHRNSLAGSTRHKLSTPSGPPALSSGKQACSPTLSPTLEHKKEEDGEDEAEEEEEYLLPDMVASEEMFMDLDELQEPATSSATTPFDDCFANHFPMPFPSPWLPKNATTAAGGS